MNSRSKRKGGLLPAVLVLFLLVVFLFPFAARLTYAGDSQGPDHILTYTTGSLTWDSATELDGQTGAARLSLFDTSYQNVLAGDTSRVVAPGTQGESIVRLKNSAAGSIRYVAVLYRIKEQDTLPVAPVLAGDAFSDTSSYPLPTGVEADQVVRAVTGSVNAGEMADFSISWLWNYYENDQRDQLDTALGDKAAFAQADDVTAGLYIVVEEDSPSPAPGQDGYIRPSPQTGDDGLLPLFAVLLAAAGLLALLRILERRGSRE